MKSAVEKYRTLPEAHRVPDAVWDLAKHEDYIRDLEHQLQLATAELAELQRRALAVLRKTWTDDDLKTAGLL